MKASYHLLASLGQNKTQILLALKQLKKYRCSVRYLQKISYPFDDLWYIIYTKKNKMV